MKILFIIPAYLPAYRYGGPIKSVHEIARQLVTLGEDVTVFTTCADGENNLDVPLATRVDIDGVKVYYFPMGKPRSYFRSPAMAKELMDRVSEFDLAHINWIYVDSTRIAARECLRQGVPYILAPRGMLDKQAIAMKGTLKKKIYLQIFEKKHLKNASTLHFTSYGERGQAFAGGWNKFSDVVYNGLDLDAYPINHSSDEFFRKFAYISGKKIVLFLGRINYIKGLDLLVSSWSTIVASNPNAHLVIAGPDDDGYGEKIKQQLNEAGISKSVTFTGMLLGSEKLAVLAAANLFVASSYLESFGMAIIEALAMKKTVVITDRVNIHKEISAANAGLVVPCDPGALAEAVLELLHDDKRCEEMGCAGRLLVEEKFTWRSSALKLQGIFKRIVT